jgi:N6-L-threonylcarbamoyladenine synthase
LIILSIETSCDETAVAILKGYKKSGNFKILSNVVSSQIKVHAEWGGVVPSLAAREHLKNIIPVFEKALAEANTNLRDIDLVAVTHGPGLIPALLIGASAARSLAYIIRKPLLGIHHIEGHIFAGYIDKKGEGNTAKYEFPILALVTSGGHTQLILISKFLDYKVVGQTRDDAVGEAFDKIAKILGLGYPGGPAISRQASKWNFQFPISNFQKIFNFQSKNSKKIQRDESGMPKNIFPRPMLNSGDFDFSFSGLKTAVLYFYEKTKKEIKDEKDLDTWKDFICFEAQEAIVEVLCKKSLKAVEKYQPKTFILAGGVAANKKLRENMKENMEKTDLEFVCPLVEYCGDNAAMIAVAAFARISNNKKILFSLRNNWKKLETDANLRIEKLS